MARLSGEEKQQVEAGALAFVQELQDASPGILAQGAAALGEAQPDPAFLQRYTENLGNWQPRKFSDAVQSLLEGG